MPDISKITLPSGTTYDLKDAQARSDIETIKSGLTGKVELIGTTTTTLSDGATTNPITINNKSVTAKAGNLVRYGQSEFLFDGTQWALMGDLSSLGDLAYKNNASGTYTPVGNVTVTTKSTTNKTATVSKASSGTATYTPEGTVAAPTISVKTAGTTQTIKNPSSVDVARTIVAAAPGGTAPDNNVTYYSVTDETLILYQLGYTTGASIETENVTVKTGDAEYKAAAPNFTGTGVRLVTGNIAVPDTFNASFVGTEDTVTVS